MKLNPQQQEIVQFDGTGSLLVMAGAGSGKTTVIAHRALRIASTIPSGTHLQMLTFSNKAATEMKDRVKRLGGAAGEGRIAFDTFHSFGLKLMKADPGAFGLAQGFSLLNETDTKRSIRYHAKASGLPKTIATADRKRLNPMSWFSTWSLARQAGYDVLNPSNRDVLAARLQQAHKLSDAETMMALATLSAYEANKLSTGSVDFDDLLYAPLKKLAKDANYREGVQGRIGGVIVDEYQDTNRIQYETIRRLALGHCGVTCVGDDDQSIYGWRGAEIGNMKRFISHFAAHTAKLEENYRSTKSIVDTASRLIAHNTERLEKRPFSNGSLGDLPSIRCAEDSRQMADQIADDIRIKIEEGTCPSEIAVLYRTNRMALLIEQGLRRHRIPYHVVGGMSLFDRAEIVAVTAALRLALNPRDTFALKSLTPYLDGFGMASAYALEEFLSSHLDADISRLDDVPGLSPARLGALKAFHLDLYKQVVSCRTVHEFIEWTTAGPMRIVERENDDQLRKRRADNLVSMADELDAELAKRRNDEPGITWRDVLLESALQGTVSDSSGDEGQPRITLSTIHRSKGLEWDSVYIAGASEGLMPLDARLDEDEEAGFSHIEEERRLSYVGLTRARRDCHVFHADEYFFPGDKESKTYELSRFITEMGLEPQPSLVPLQATQDDFSGFHSQLASMFPR